MSSVDGLAPDQRAVLQLVLQRGRSYDEIAQMLSIERAAVRERALGALEALGPQTGIDPQRRALITDYLLGQLPPAAAAEARDSLAASPSERAWARVIASELAPIASGPLPEIPSSAAPPAPQTPAPEPQPTSGTPRPPSSRLGGLILIGLAAVAAIVVAIVLITNGGSSKHPSQASHSSSSTAASVTTTSSSSSTAAKIVAQINLAPSQSHSKAAGIAEVLKEGTNRGIAIVADHVAPNTTRPPNAYAVWLYNSASNAQLLGFVNPGVGKNGRLSTAGGLPTNAGHFRQLIVTLETKANPKTPGTIVLHGVLSGLS